MFVFKAAVVGAGVMGGEIAQVIAAADIPVLLKDVDRKLVDAGLDKAREVTRSQVDKLVEKEKISAEQGSTQLDRTLAIHTRAAVALVGREERDWCMALDSGMGDWRARQDSNLRPPA